MPDPGTKNNKQKELLKQKKYFSCKRCGYVTIIRDSYCPICAKEGIKIKMK